jgi:hypothetical integral membrane protein (TIGR02206 family)
MPAHLHLFGLVHLVILGAVPLLAALLAALQRRLGPGSRGVRYGLAFLLCMCSVLYYGNFALHGERMFPGHLPLELCDASLWLLVLALLTLKPPIFDLAYYPGLAGASMALLTPNMQEPSLFLSVQFFADHGLIVTSILYLVWSRQARPRPGSVGRVILAINLFAILAGAFDFYFKTDYMFLRAKPVTVSALDLLGPWPWYILSCQGVALGLFLLLYLPFRPRTEPSAAAADTGISRPCDSC